MGGRRTPRRARRQHAGRSDLSHPAIELRLLTDTPDDRGVGQELVREYVVATAEEQAGPDVEPDIARLLPYIPDWDDFAGRFLRSGGAFVVASVDGATAGCVGITPLDDGVCEMNRLWVRAPYRRSGLGRRLAAASMENARRLGFTHMLLDVLPSRTGAIALYRSLGFTDAPPLHDYAFPMVFLGRDLEPFEPTSPGLSGGPDEDGPH
jgi:ribosomal protein S18 acetylase RimI-like enzyme